jgi:A/G-specific adenine glycosylase
MTPLLEVDWNAFSTGASVLRQRLLSWWAQHGRHAIPWKLLPDGRRPEPDQVLDSYVIWIAEVMLQQTQLQVDLPYWRRWLAAFPTLESLAQANGQQALMLWQGLGYHSRARRLHQGSQQLLGAND